jgi:isopenicillin N synthase-like dioxygenase
MTLPVLDLARLDGGEAGATAFREALLAATHEVGFFYLTGHGIPDDVTGRLFAEAERFFALPLEDKQRVEMLQSPHFRGYTRAGGELTAGAADWREQIDLGAERAVDEGPGPAYLRLEGPNLWPDAQPSLRDAVTDWEQRCTAVARRLLAVLGAGARQPGRRLRQRLRRPAFHADQADPLPGREERGQGVGAHKDPGCHDAAP